MRRRGLTVMAHTGIYYRKLTNEEIARGVKGCNPWKHNSAVPIIIKPKKEGPE